MKYLNNRLEGDHGKLKRLIKPTLGFQSMKTAYATIKGFEVMRMFRRASSTLEKPWAAGPRHHPWVTPEDNTCTLAELAVCHAGTR